MLLSEKHIFFVKFKDWIGQEASNQMLHVFRKMKEWFQSKKLVVRFLSEEEYREQAEAETTSALEELRQACRRADFPSWLAVSKLQAPKK